MSAGEVRAEIGQAIWPMRQALRPAALPGQACEDAHAETAGIMQDIDALLGRISVLGQHIISGQNQSIGVEKAIQDGAAQLSAPLQGSNPDVHAAVIGGLSQAQQRFGSLNRVFIQDEDLVSQMSNRLSDVKSLVHDIGAHMIYGRQESGEARADAVQAIQAAEGYGNSL